MHMLSPPRLRLALLAATAGAVEQVTIAAEELEELGMAVGTVDASEHRGLAAEAGYSYKRVEGADGKEHQGAR